MKWSANALALIITAFTFIITTEAKATDFLVTPSDRIFEKLFVRDAPDGPIIDNLYPGQTAEYLDAVPFWYKVELKNGVEGFVAKGYSRLIPIVTGRPELSIHYFQNGAGTCVLVKCPAANKSILMDCGSWPSNSDTNFHHTEVEIGNRIKAVLGNDELSAVFSHGDIDHYSYVPIALQGIQLKEIWLGGFSTYYSQADFDDWVDDQETAGAHVHKDMPINFHSPTDTPEPHLTCGDADVFVLSNRAAGNTTPNKSRRNRNSLTALVEYDDFRAIFTGDAEGVTEAQILDDYPTITANVVTGSHHGSKTHNSNHDEWIRRIKPKAVVYTSGFANAHPTCEATGRFRTNLATVSEHKFTCDATKTKPATLSDRAEFGTEMLGDITITSNGLSPFLVECSASDCSSIIPH